MPIVEVSLQTGLYLPPRHLWSSNPSRHCITRAQDTNGGLKRFSGAIARAQRPFDSGCCERGSGCLRKPTELVSLKRERWQPQVLTGTSLSLGATPGSARVGRNCLHVQRYQKIETHGSIETLEGGTSVQRGKSDEKLPPRIYELRNNDSAMSSASTSQQRRKDHEDVEQDSERRHGFGFVSRTTSDEVNVGGEPLSLHLEGVGYVSLAHNLETCGEALHLREGNLEEQDSASGDIVQTSLEIGRNVAQQRADETQCRLLIGEVSEESRRDEESLRQRDERRNSSTSDGLDSEAIMISGVREGETYLIGQREADAKSERQESKEEFRVEGEGNEPTMKTKSVHDDEGEEGSTTGSKASVGAGKEPVLPMIEARSSNEKGDFFQSLVTAEGAKEGGKKGGHVKSAWRTLQRWSRSLRLLNSREENALTTTTKVVVLGGGSFGTAVGVLLARNKATMDVVLLMRSAEQCEDVNQHNTNKKCFPKHQLPANVRATVDPREALDGAQYCIHAVPVQASSAYLSGIAEFVPPNLPIFCVSKGLEVGSLEMMSQVIPRALGNPRQPVAVLSGPSFSIELMDELPTAIVAASKDKQLARAAQQLLASRYLRVNTSSDVVGVEMAGALKNVLAIAAGIVEGMRLGNNCMAALVAQGCAEIRWLAEKMGANPATLAGLSGTGDIMLTCFVNLSRNRSVGVRLGAGEKLEDILGSMNQVAEGVATAGAVIALGRKYRVQMPVLTAVARILENELTPKKAVLELMSLPQVEER
eukprot:TRINITY_DN10036_c0_g2_i2.p1 TRINITY_DN10036_c0_g2~~TRINITY_DN10036_c0_g2_i2.p1  ORF type:complete len:762 (+),score=76.61 TRINITY_DN10036_c0_g2_i2:665-2950(+)